MSRQIALGRTARYVLQPGEQWAAVRSLGGIIVAHPERPLKFVRSINDNIIEENSNVSDSLLYFSSPGEIGRRPLPQRTVFPRFASDFASPAPKPAKPKPKNYDTVGVRFIQGHDLHKVYTYRVRKGAKLHLGQEIIVPTDQGDKVVVVVEIHKTPQDTGLFDYKFVKGRVAKL